MPERRAIGEGSAYRRKDENGKEIKDAWVGQITIRGRRKTVTGKTKREVLDRIQELKKTLLPPDAETLLFKDFIADWLENEKRRTVKDSTYDRIECTIENNAIPYLGEYTMNKLNYELIQRSVINRMQDEGKAYSTIKKAYNILNECLRYAIFPKEILIKNPMMGVKMPSRDKFEQKDIRYLTEEEIARFKAAALAKWGNDADIYPLGYSMILMLNTGVRVGEALAWTWKDYDEEKGLIHVNGTMARVRNRDGGSRKWKQQLQSTKTKNGRRSIPVNAAARNALAELRQRRYFGEDSPILAQADGTFNTVDNYTRTFEAIIKRAGIEHCGIHTLRHTFATQLIAKGTDVKIVSSLLGHSAVEITYNIYVHALDESSKKAVEMLCDI